MVKVLYPAISSHIQPYPAVSSCIQLLHTAASVSCIQTAPLRVYFITPRLWALPERSAGRAGTVPLAALQPSPLPAASPSSPQPQPSPLPLPQPLPQRLRERRCAPARHGRDCCCSSSLGCVVYLRGARAGSLSAAMSWMAAALTACVVKGRGQCISGWCEWAVGWSWEVQVWG